MRKEALMTKYHVPVMLDECLEGLAIKSDGVYVDVTYGGGGHSKAILEKLGDEGVLLVFDQDADALENKVEDSRLRFCHANFKYLKNFCSFYGFEKIDGLLADLGVSSHHLDEESRGFSFRFGEAELDMRMNTKSGVTASSVLNTYDQPRLARIFRSYGELNKASQIANAIVNFRSGKEIKTTVDLEMAISKFLNDKTRNKTLAKVYQAVRLEVNQEMETLKDMLTQSVDLLKPEGRLVVMSYHSLEDRLVKNLVQTGNVEGERVTDSFGNVNNVLKAINKKPVVAKAEEIVANSRSRSAKLRVAEKVG